MGLTTHERFLAVQDAVVQLKEALAGVGVVLPSVGMDQVSAAGAYGLPLIDLGRCNLDTALRLTAVLHERARPVTP
ncbi:hypothetical protein ACM614_24855 [Streptomyces sp. 12297]|uniref:hypothetical protein n=1 Tax=Streptomyces sp. NBC_00239 TaxID=2903640 RepID=UPI002E2D3CF6|nr:hypothetical protein [Streptomyces sp. NBC_00239]